MDAADPDLDKGIVTAEGIRIGAGKQLGVAVNHYRVGDLWQRHGWQDVVLEAAAGKWDVEIDRVGETGVGVGGENRCSKRSGRGMDVVTVVFVRGHCEGHRRRQAAIFEHFEAQMKGAWPPRPSADSRYGRYCVLPVSEWDAVHVSPPFKSKLKTQVPARRNWTMPGRCR